jgi:hypothetical protein
MMRVLLRSAAVSLLATPGALLVFFFLGSYTFIPTAAAASLKAVPVAQQAAWIAANTKVVTGLSYASFVAPTLRCARPPYQVPHTYSCSVWYVRSQVRSFSAAAQASNISFKADGFAAA